MARKQTLQNALDHHLAGRASQAEVIYQQILKKEPNNPDALHLAGVLAHQGKKNEQAAKLIKRAISCKPAFPEAYCNLGNILRELGDIEGASDSYRKALAIRPDWIGAHNNLGNILRDQGQLDQAIASYRRALSYKPDHAEAHYNLAIALEEQGNVAAAVESFRQAIAHKPGVAEVYCNLAAALNTLGHIDEAISNYQQAISYKPDYADASINLGVLLQGKGDLVGAIQMYQKIISCRPDCAEAYCNLASILKDIGKLDQAIEVYRLAIAHKPGLAEAHYNLGNALQIQGKPAEASQAYLHALALKPDYLDVLNNLGNLLQAQGELAAAAVQFKQALSFNPTYAEAFNNLGNVLKQQGLLDEAIGCYRRAVELKPEYLEAHSNLLFTLNSHPQSTQSQYLIEAKRFGEIALVLAKPYANWITHSKANSLRRLRVGLVSGDLKSHPVGYFIESILNHINPNRIELVAYSTKAQEDGLTERIKPFLSAWNLIAGQSDEAAARRIYEDGIDVLVDLAGHTAFNRLPLFAWKPAPVQVSWLGYFASTGLASMDFLLADALSIPDSRRSNFTEKIWHLPDTRLCFTPPEGGDKMAVSALPAYHNGYITFGCVQTLSKISDEVLELWGRVFSALPDARLRLQNKQMNCLTTREQMRGRLARFGIAQERAILSGSVSRAEYLAAYAEVDIMLDTFPYPGGTTTCEALWMGVPTLTLAGDTLLACQGASLLTAAGLSNWVASSAEDYAAKAVTFSLDLSNLSAMRARLRKQVSSSSLFDAKRFAQNLEAALWGMWESVCSKSNNEFGVGMDKVFLHVGCGSKRKDQTTAGFNCDSWRELRLDINESVNHDIVGTMTDMQGVASESMDAIFSSHNIEHLYPHEVPVALKEFIRVLKPDGMLVVTCPDLQSVCALIADDKLTEPAYTSPAGSIAPIDILYGHRPSMGCGNLYMAHRCGFTTKVLIGTLRSCGFKTVAAARRGSPHFDLWAIASKLELSHEDMHRLASQHFPVG